MDVRAMARFRVSEIAHAALIGPRTCLREAGGMAHVETAAGGWRCRAPPEDGETQGQVDPGNN
eukprot:943119-Pyramimonas_sp.AAC.1